MRTVWRIRRFRRSLGHHCASPLAPLSAARSAFSLPSIPVCPYTLPTERANGGNLLHELLYTLHQCNIGTRRPLLCGHLVSVYGVEKHGDVLVVGRALEQKTHVVGYGTKFRRVVGGEGCAKEVGVPTVKKNWSVERAPIALVALYCDTPTSRFTTSLSGYCDFT